MTYRPKGNLFKHLFPPGILEVNKKDINLSITQHSAAPNSVFSALALMPYRYESQALNFSLNNWKGVVPHGRRLLK